MKLEQLISYQDWAAQRLAEMKKADTAIDCPDCDGDGETECFACNHEEFCERCAGTGKISVNDHSRYAPLPVDYYEAVKADITTYCKWKNKDFAEVFGPIEADMCNNLPGVAHHVAKQKKQEAAA